MASDADYPSVARVTGVGWANGVGRFGAIAGPSYGALIISIAGGSVIVMAVSMALPAVLGGLVMAWLPRRHSSHALRREVPVIARAEVGSQRDAPTAQSLAIDPVQRCPGSAESPGSGDDLSPARRQA